MDREFLESEMGQAGTLYLSESHSWFRRTSEGLEGNLFSIPVSKPF